MKKFFTDLKQCYILVYKQRVNDRKEPKMAKREFNGQMSESQVKQAIQQMRSEGTKEFAVIGDEHAFRNQWMFLENCCSDKGTKVINNTLSFVLGC